MTTEPDNGAVKAGKKRKRGHATSSKGSKRARPELESKTEPNGRTNDDKPTSSTPERNSRNGTHNLKVVESSKSVDSTPDSDPQERAGSDAAKAKSSPPILSSRTDNDDVHLEIDVNSSELILSSKSRRKRHRKRSSGPSLAVAQANPQEEQQVRLARSNGWTLTLPAGGNIINQDPIFIPVANGEGYMVSANSREVQLLDLETSLIQKTFASPDGRSIRLLASSSSHEGRVYVVCSDNSVWRCDCDAGGPMTVEMVQQSNDIRALSVGPNFDQTGDSLFYLIESSKHFAIRQDKKELFRTRSNLVGLQVFGDSDFIVGHGSTTVVLGMKQARSKPSDHDFVWLEVPMKGQITCIDGRIVSFVPASEKGQKRQAGMSLVVGRQDGQLHLYDDVSTIFSKQGQSTLPMPRVLHWHREPARSVKFSRDGNYLVSGGHETVLVLWQLATGHQQYLPHLTSTIERITISPRGDRYALQMGDNSIMVLSTSELKPVANFAGLQMLSGPRLDVRKRPAVILDPREPDHLLLTVPATQPLLKTESMARPFLQTFDLHHSRHITRQALTRNNATDFNLSPEQTPIVPPDVNLLQISHDGEWLATVDEWKPPLHDMETFAPESVELQYEEQLRRRETHLKIWKRDEKQGLWSLVTRVDRPHARHEKHKPGVGRVFALKSDPSSIGFATTGEDGCVRVWRPKQRMRHGVVMKVGEAQQELVEWTCRITVELPAAAERTDSPLDVDDTQPSSIRGACLAFSEDGSLLAAGQTRSDTDDEEAPVHFITTATGHISTRSLIAPVGLFDMAFLGRLFITISRSAFRTWDLLEDKLRRQLNFTPSINASPILAVNPAEDTIAICSDSRVSIYKAGFETPVYQTDLEVPVAAALAHGTGYTFILTDCTSRSLRPAIGLERRRALSQRSQIDPSAAMENIILGEEESEAPADLLTASAREAQSTAPPDLESPGDIDEDDRPVVAPEQLARIFDVGQSFAMPPVQDMFRAVLGLFERKLPTRVVDATA